MLNRRDWFLALIPFCMLGGAVLRAKEKIATHIGARGKCVQYLWDDGSGWRNDPVPLDVKPKCTAIEWKDWPTNG